MKSPKLDGNAIELTKLWLEYHDGELVLFGEDSQMNIYSSDGDNWELVSEVKLLKSL